MKRLALRVEAFAMAVGGPGLFVVAFLDSSFLSLPEINDILLIWMVTQHKERMLYYSTMATLGSITGCLTLYYIGRKGGETLLRRRFAGPKLERAFALVHRYGVVSVLVPALLPPPAPFKIFVLLAGVAGISTVNFTAAIAVGRGLRYLAEGMLAVRFGDRAIEFVHRNGGMISVVLAVLVLLGVVAYVGWVRYRRQARRAGEVSL